MILNIVKGEDQPVLRQKAAQIPGPNNELKKLAKNMIETMENANGIGLAAPQIAISKRMVIVKLTTQGKRQLIVPMINPQILEFSEETEVKEEGCLSLPDLFLKIRRPKNIKVKFVDLQGDSQILKLEGINARVVQHEIDHLDGILITDRVLETDNLVA